MPIWNTHTKKSKNKTWMHTIVCPVHCNEFRHLIHIQVALPFTLKFSTVPLRPEEGIHLTSNENVQQSSAQPAVFTMACGGGWVQTGLFGSVCVVMPAPTVSLFSRLGTCFRNKYSIGNICSFTPALEAGKLCEHTVPLEFPRTA